MESGDNPIDLHLTGKQAGVAAAEAGVGRLVLTHIPPWHDREVPRAEAAEAFDGPLDVAAHRDDVHARARPMARGR